MFGILEATTNQYKIIVLILMKQRIWNGIQLREVYYYLEVRIVK